MMRKFLTLSIVILINIISATAQGVFTSAATGNWNDAAKWTLTSGMDADGIPDSDDDVTVNLTHLITLTQNEACNNLTISSPNGNRLACGAFTLEIYGTLAHTVAPTSENYITSTIGSVGIKFVGNTSRALFTTGAGVGNGYEVEVDITSAIGTSITAHKFRALYITSGTFKTTGELRIDGGSDGQDDGKIYVAPNGTLIGELIIGARSGTNTTYCGSITIDGTLETKGLRLNGKTITINGILRLTRSTDGLMSLPSDTEFIYGSSASVEYNSLTANIVGAEVDRAAAADPVIPKIKINCGTTVSTNNKTITCDNLEFASGKLAVSAASVFTVTDGAKITGYDATKYVFTTSGTGKLKINNIGASNITFPVGPTASLYHPVTISNTGTTDDFSVGVSSSLPTCLSTVPTESVTTTWDISEGVAGGSNCTIGLNYTGSAKGGIYNSSNAKIVHCNGTSVDYFNGSVSGSVASGGGFTTFSPFGISSGAAVLPVSFSDFNVTKQKNYSNLSFSTASETNNSHFNIERSADAINFENIGEIKGAGNSSSEISYTYTDEKPLPGINYYRIKQTDYDGQYSYTEIKSVSHKGLSHVSVTPRTTEGRLDIATELADYTLAIYNISGQEVKRMVGMSQDQSISVETLNAGVYFVKINSTYVSETVRIVKI
jgi:Secretion system C-terminal sorting domain